MYKKHQLLTIDHQKDDNPDREKQLLASAEQNFIDFLIMQDINTKPDAVKNPNFRKSAARPSSIIKTHDISK